MLRYSCFVLFFFSAFSYSIIKDYTQPDSSSNISEYDSGNGIWQHFRGYYDNAELTIHGWYCSKSDNPVSLSYKRKIQDEIEGAFSSSFSVLYTETVCHVDWIEDKEKYSTQDKYSNAEMYFTYSLYFCPERKSFTNNNMNNVEGCPLPPKGGLEGYCLEQPPILNASSSNAWKENDNTFINHNGCKYEAYGIIVGSNGVYAADWRPVGKSDSSHSSGSLTAKKPTDPTNPTEPTNPGGNGDLKYIAKDVSEINSNTEAMSHRTNDIFELIDSKYKNISWDDEQKIYQSINDDFSLKGSLPNDIMNSISDYFADDFLNALNQGALNNLSSFDSKYSYGLTDLTKTHSLSAIANSVGSGVDSLDFGDDYDKYFYQTDFFYHFDFINALIPQYKQCQPIEFFEGIYTFSLSCSDIERVREVLFYVFFFYTAWFVFTKFSTLLANKD